MTRRWTRGNGSSTYGWIGALLAVWCGAAGAAAGCSSSAPPEGNGGGADASLDSTSDGTTTTCGNVGQACCNGSECFGALQCVSGACAPPEAGTGDDGAPGAEAAADATGSDTGSGGDAGNGGDAPADDGAADSGAGDDGATSDAPSSEGGADAAPDVLCGTSPTLHEEPAGSIYCGFFADGGTAALFCTTGQQCCMGGSTDGVTFDPDQCASLGATCTNGGEPDAGGIAAVPIECAQITDCTANGIAATGCCLQGATAPAAEPGCTYPRARLGTAIVCETSDAGAGAPAACAPGEYNVCSSQADCPAGTTCTAGKWKIFQVGFCL